MLPILEIRQLAVAFDNKKILKKIDANFYPHQITAIIGPSGCGKSTFLKSLNRLIEDERGVSMSGQIHLDGEDTFTLSPEEVRRRIGMVFQSPTPFPLSIYDNMAYPLRYHGHGAKKNKKSLDSIIRNKLEDVGLFEEVEDNLAMNATLLSGGQQQRLCIARALTVEPEILLLDEPCSSLDVKNTQNIEMMLRTLCQQYSIIIVTHNLFQARRISHQTLFMLDGEIIEAGSTKDLFENPRDSRTAEYISGIYG
jgi:phosphate transport system ATP-binding protein